VALTGKGLIYDNTQVERQGEFTLRSGDPFQRFNINYDENTFLTKGGNYVSLPALPSHAVFG
jgi:hypothetical protein